jgi:hypothetical protein
VRLALSPLRPSKPLQQQQQQQQQHQQLQPAPAVKPQLAGEALLPRLAAALPGVTLLPDHRTAGGGSRPGAAWVHASSLPVVLPQLLKLAAAAGDQAAQAASQQ